MSLDLHGTADMLDDDLVRGDAADLHMYKLWGRMGCGGCRVASTRRRRSLKSHRVGKHRGYMANQNVSNLISTTSRFQTIGLRFAPRLVALSEASSGNGHQTCISYQQPGRHFHVSFPHIKSLWYLLDLRSPAGSGKVVENA